MNERESDTTARVPQGDGTEYLFKIEAYTPETIPMARLAEYMAQLALILGETASVHFARLESGSTVLVNRIAREAIPKVRYRAAGIQRGDAPRDALRAFEAMNELLREDNGVASLTEGAREVVLNFPGREQSQETYSTVRQEGSIDAEIIRVGGSEQRVPVLLMSEGVQIAGCFADRHIAKQLAKQLFEFARLYGTGRWRRDSDGVWSLVDFKINNFEVLSRIPLSSVLAQLRETSSDFGPDAYEELNVIRHGPDGEEQW